MEPSQAATFKAFDELCFEFSFIMPIRTYRWLVLFCSTKRRYPTLCQKSYEIQFESDQTKINRSSWKHSVQFHFHIGNVDSILILCHFFSNVINEIHYQYEIFALIALMWLIHQSQQMNMRTAMHRQQKWPSKKKIIDSSQNQIYSSVTFAIVYCAKPSDDSQK